MGKRQRFRVICLFRRFRGPSNLRDAESPFLYLESISNVLWAIKLWKRENKIFIRLCRWDQAKRGYQMDVFIGISNVDVQARFPIRDVLVCPRAGRVLYYSVEFFHALMDRMIQPLKNWKIGRNVSRHSQYVPWEREPLSEDIKSTFIVTKHNDEDDFSISSSSPCACFVGFNELLQFPFAIYHDTTWGGYSNTFKMFFLRVPCSSRHFMFSASPTNDTWHIITFAFSF